MTPVTRSPQCGGRWRGARRSRPPTIISGSHGERPHDAATGFCGAYTTFSTFAFETVQLIEESAVAEAAMNIGATVLTSGLATGAGFLLASA
jgi:hypothetical protein